MSKIYCLCNTQRAIQVDEIAYGDLNCFASQCFTRAMNRVFSDLLFSELVLYVDDLCSFASGFKEALERLERVFQRLDEAGLKIKTSKCHFFYEGVELLGFNVSRDGIRPLEERVEALTKLSTPKSVKDARSLLGAFSYYRKFVKCNSISLKGTHQAR